jgi:hypothetical protein
MEESDGAANGESGRDEIPPQKRKQARRRDKHTCQLCRQKAPEAGGVMRVEVHHKTYDPVDCDLHDLENLITLCRRCHHYHHNRPSNDPLPADISEEAESVLLEVDIEIIQLLMEEGPLTIDEIDERITADKARQSVKERLYRVMGLDNEIETQEVQLVDQDLHTGKWGIPYQIDEPERRIPDERQPIVRRTIDKIVQLGLERGYDRETIADIIGINPRTVYMYKYRSYAYDFPLEMFSGKGRPLKNGGGEINHEDVNDNFDVSEAQQQLDANAGESATAMDIGNNSDA